MTSGGFFSSPGDEKNNRGERSDASLIVKNRKQQKASVRTWFRCAGCGMYGDYTTSDAAEADALLGTMDRLHQRHCGSLRPRVAPIGLPDTCPPGAGGGELTAGSAPRGPAVNETTVQR